MQTGNRKSVTLVLGGARSGKSRFAQQLAAGAGKVTFFATAQPTDEEMRRKIERHRRERPTSWVTVEVPVELDSAIREHSQGSELLLVDCLTLYAANIMSYDRENKDLIHKRVQLLCETLCSVQPSVVLVSNEVGSGVVPSFPAGVLFRELLGEINQKVARIADNVLLMFAGLPLALKGKVETGL
ncbi:MAG TPA: bifunctional adenosylcobinamide kinase/adenosylcobinamide-phosphate guanylyltransferase [Terriglobales bacterium]|jgi:adenosylcobinamide kinase/adenosylcobinamide-phosphate guanylyltransferase|nr:bifunctional adenosylcobinamide kinase/adenosylcobinamide-phosphate guanylyltransferase [Terriglobales bacterium]